MRVRLVDLLHLVQVVALLIACSVLFQLAAIL